jgi:4-amino-4-deoxy-L-arabinose transferase-like glycosyltransferase
MILGLGGRLRFSHWLGVILGVALVIRIVVVLGTPHYVPQSDAADYDRIAVSLARHNQFPSSVLTPDGGPTAYRAPLFPIALAVVYKLVGVGSAATRWEAGRIFEAVLGTIIVALTALVALRLWGRREALLSGAIAAVYPPLIIVGSSLMTEPLFVALVLAAVLTALVHRDSTRRWRWLIATGVLVALAGLTHGNGILLLAPIVFLVWSDRPRLAWRSLRAPIAVVAAAVITLVPWTVRNANVFHTFVPITTESGYLLAGVYDRSTAHETRYPALWEPPFAGEARVLARHADLNEAQISSRLNTVAIDYLDAHPAYVLKVLYWNTLRLLDLTGAGVERWAASFEGYPPGLVDVSVYTFWALGLLVLGALATRAVRRVPWALWLCPVVLLVPNMLAAGLARYRSPVDPFLIMIAALGLRAAYERLEGRRRVPAAVPSAAA